MKVRRYEPERSARRCERTVVDFDEVETTDRYLVLSVDGGILRIGMERLDLCWPDLRLLAEEIVKAGVRFDPN